MLCSVIRITYGLRGIVFIVIRTLCELQYFTCYDESLCVTNIPLKNRVVGRMAFVNGEKSVLLIGSMDLVKLWSAGRKKNCIKILIR
jgi:hypothetical protein